MSHKGNSLSFLSQYNSDDEEDEDQDSDNKPTVDNFQLSCDWTKCFAKDSGHPYYWNVVSREVTWEIPISYENYLDELKSKGLQHLENDPASWNECNGDDDETYYINKINRVVSWEQPVGFKKKPVPKKQKDASRRQSKKLVKKKTNPFSNMDDIDEKIELITHFSDKSDSSSDEETKVSPKNGSQDAKKSSVKSILVPQYDESGEISEDEKTKRYDKPLFPSTSSQNAHFIPPPTQQTGLLSQHRIYSIKNDSNISESTNVNSPDISSENTSVSNVVSMPIETVENKEEIDKVEPPEPTKPSLLDLNDPDFDSKTFKRRRRIQFQKPKKGQQQPMATLNPESESNPDKLKTDYTNFVKSSSDDTEPNAQNGDDSIELTTGEDNKQLHTKEITESGCLIRDKLKFLNANIAPAVSVTVMLIQVETLLKAYDEKSLSEEYLLKWIRETNETLGSLEKEAITEGWICEWDRTNSQYSYRNLSSGKVQWEFPISEEEALEKELQEIERKMLEEKKLEAEKVEAAKNETVSTAVVSQRSIAQDEMDISTTPPPLPRESEVNNVNFASDDLEPISPEMETSFDVPSPPPPPIISYNEEPSKSFGSELESFYSDLAAMEPPAPEIVPETKTTEPIATTVKRPATEESTVPVKPKKKKKQKVTTLNARMNDISGMVAKWQKIQEETNK